MARAFFSFFSLLSPDPVGFHRTSRAGAKQCPGGNSGFDHKATLVSAVKEDVAASLDWAFFRIRETAAWYGTSGTGLDWFGLLLWTRWKLREAGWLVLV